MLNSKARGMSTAGEMVNLMSVDAQRLMELMTYINSLWSSPLQIAGAIYFLYNTLGISVLAGVGVLILIIPVNMLFGSRWHSLQVTIISLFTVFYANFAMSFANCLWKSASSSCDRNKYSGINRFPVHAVNKEENSAINRVAITETASLEEVDRPSSYSAIFMMTSETSAITIFVRFYFTLCYLMLTL